MNRNKIKLKYLLGIWKTLPDYPTKEDVIYELSAFLLKDGRPNGEFSQQTFKTIFGAGWENSSCGEIVNELILSDDFQETKKSTETKKWYKIKNNTYYTN